MTNHLTASIDEFEIKAVFGTYTFASNPLLKDYSLQFAYFF